MDRFASPAAAEPAAVAAAVTPALTPALTVHDLTAGYDRHPAVHHLGFALAPGSLTAIVGPNGAGKSTLLKALAGVLPVMGGRVAHGPQVRRVAYLPQQAEIDRSFPVTVRDTVAMGLWHEVGPWRPLGRARWARCDAALAAVGLQGFERRTLDTLSGGQFQRVLFARLMLRDAQLLLLDEPFAAVDAPTVDALLAVVHRWQAEGRTVLVVLHDLQQVRRHCPQTLLLAREAVAFGATAEVLSPAHLARAAALHEAFDDAAAPCVAPAGADAHAHASAHAHPHGHDHDRHSHAHDQGPAHAPAPHHR
jgi:zinc/manganese transport system ATP-binding protein